MFIECSTFIEPTLWLPAPMPNSQETGEGGGGGTESTSLEVQCPISSPALGVAWHLLLVGPLSFLKSEVNAAVDQEILEHLTLPAADQFYGDADFSFSSGTWRLPKLSVPGVKDHMVFLFLTGPENSPDLKPRENPWGY